MAPSQLRILVVDDNAENRALARATLEDEGYQLDLAHDGTQALAMYQAKAPDCILLDVQMPDIDGVEVCRRIRALPGGGDVAIVFVTAQREIAIFDSALDAGGDDFLTKPFRPSELVVRVQTAMRLRRLAGERTELFGQVKRQRDDLQRIQLQKEQLIAFLVHDLKNPVNAIELQAERCLRDPGATERTKSAADAIRAESRSLMRMILDLLDLGRSDEGRLGVNRASIDALGFLGAVVDEFRAAAARARVELAIDCNATRPAFGDPALLHRVLGNLVENAIRHAPEDSVVTLGCTQTADATELRIGDRGVGIPDEMRARVFERFETAGGTRNRGLGLAFCRVAVVAHGGSIWIEDANPGAVFAVRIPDSQPL